MTKKTGKLERLTVKVKGVVKPRGGYFGSAHIDTGRSAENFLWKLAVDAGYGLGDDVEYEISIRRKHQS